MTTTPPEKQLHELLSRSMVDIYVGTENTHWILHEKLLCHHSPFFRKIFYSKTSSHYKTQSFGLPDEEDATFKTFVGWLYSSSLPVPREEVDLGLCFDLYLMAEKFEIPALVSDLLQVVREWYKYSDTYPGLRRVQYIYANTEEGSPMRHMLVHSVARLLALEKGIPAHWDKALRKNGQLAVDIILAIQDWRLEEDLIPDAREDPDEAEDLIDVPQEIERLDQEAEAELQGTDGDIEEMADADADESEDTVVESPTTEKKHNDVPPTANKDTNETKDDVTALKKGTKNTKDIKANVTASKKDFAQFSLKEIPSGLTHGDYGTLRA